MKYDEDNKGAFPVATANWSYQGMTLRDYFAAKAMEGTIASADYDFDSRQRANWAYKMADAMLLERDE